MVEGTGAAMGVPGLLQVQRGVSRILRASGDPLCARWEENTTVGEIVMIMMGNGETSGD